MALNPNTLAQQQAFNKQSKSKAPKQDSVSKPGLEPAPLTYTQPAPYGSYNQPGTAAYPLDIVQLDIYNDQDFYFETINEASSYRIQGSDLFVDLEKELTSVGYEAGEFRVAIRPLRNYLGSAAGLKLAVQEISSDRLEVRLVPTQINIGDDPESQKAAVNTNLTFAKLFSQDFFKFDKQAVLASLYLFIDQITSVEVNDYIQDKFTVSSAPYSIIFKLNQQLPPSVAVGSRVWIAQELNPPVIESVLIVPKVIGRQLRRIKGPNFDALRKRSVVTDTDYLSWDEILSESTGSTVRTIFSQSLVEGIELNVDYRRFENFVKFSDATDRLKNFEYKVRLLEDYQSTVSSLAASNAVDSFYVQTQITTTQNKIDNLIGAFDGFEKYLYFESSSYVTNSFGEFLDMSWPKSTSTKPYALYSYTSSQAETWFDGIVQSASLYDNINPHSLWKLVPNHIQEQNEDLVNSFVNMLGHFFDIQYEYVNQLSKIHDRQEKLTEGFAKELVYHVGKSLGVDFNNGDNFEDLWTYTLGVNSSGSYTAGNVFQISGEDRTRETWKRIINNLPHLLATKGTERGIRALLNCFGIPSTVIRVKEFGGPEPDLDKASQYKHDRFSYFTQVGKRADGGFQYVSIPGSGKTVEWRMQMAPHQTTGQQLATLNGTAILASGSASDGYIIVGATKISSSIYDGTPHSFAVNEEGMLYVSKVSSGIVSTVSASTSLTVGTLVLPATTAGSRPFSGSVQDVRYWNVYLLERVIRAHAYGPSSYFNDDSTTETGGTGSYDSLTTRIALGATNKRYNAAPTTEASVHPNGAGGATATFSNFVTSSSVPTVETHYLEWPDIAGNRQVSNKVRFDSTFTTDNLLRRDIKVQTSLQDNQPVDSSRLGIYLSPVDEINQDIAEQFGGITLDDYIGAYNDIYEQDYADLKGLKSFYLQKADGRFKSQNYVRLLRYFNAAAFTMTKQLVPHRANLQTGLVIEPDLLTRSKLKLADRPEWESLYYKAELELPSTIDPAAETDVIEPGEIEVITQIIVGDNLTVAEGGLGLPAASVSGKVNEYNRYQVPAQGTKLETTYSGSTPGSIINRRESLEDTIDVNTTSYGTSKNEGSRYEFYTWTGPVEDPTVYEGSGLVSNSANFIYVPSVGADYSYPIGTQVYTSRRSAILSPGNIVYKQGGDILRGQARGLNWYTDVTDLRFSGSYGQLPIARLGIRFFPNTSAAHWRYTAATNTLQAPVAVGVFPKITIPLPYAEAPNAVYELSFGGSSIAISNFGFAFAGPSAGTQLRGASRDYAELIFNGGEQITNLKLSITNYPGQFQDHQIGPNASIGQRNQKYNGCKMTSPDFNEDSPDTLDGGPVITITEGPAINLNVDPNQAGTYTFR